MKILFFSDSHPQSSSFIWQDFSHIREQEKAWYIFTQPSTFATDSQLLFVPFPLQSLRSRIAWRFEKWGLAVNYVDANFSKRLSALVEEIKPDIIHCEFAYEGIKLWDNLKNRADYTFLFSFRGYDSSYKLKNKAYRKKMASILAQPNVYSHSVCDYLKQNLNKNGIQTPRHQVIYTGVDVDFFSPEESVSPQIPVFIQTGAFNDKKGQEITLQAFSLFLKENPSKPATLTFIGAGKNLEKCKQLAHSLGISQQVVFVGKMNKAGIKKALLSASVFVHHSLTAENGDQEGIPNALAEAMALGLPVISTFHAGIPELVQPKAKGILVKERDIPAYAKAMADLYSEKKSVENRNIVLEQFSLATHLERFYSYYREMATH